MSIHLLVPTVRTADTAARLDVTVTRVHQMIEAGVLRPIGKEGRSFVFAEPDVDRLRDARRLLGMQG